MSKKDNKDKDNTPLVQARSEDSVLFSLNALTQQQPTSSASAAPDTAGNAQDDSSGFINLNAIATASQFVGNDGEQANNAAPIVAPTMIPMSQEPKTSPIAYISIGIAVLLLIVVIGLLVFVVTKQDATQTQPPVATANNGANAQPAAADKNDDKDEKDDNADKVVAKDDEDEDDEEDDTADSDEEETAESDEEDTAAADAKKLSPEEEAALAKKKEEAEQRRKEHEEKMRTDPKYRKEYLQKQKERKERLAAEKAAAQKAAAEKAAAEKAAADKAPTKTASKGKNDGIPSGGIGDILNDIERGGKSKTASTKPPESAAPPASEGLSRSAIKSTVGRYYGRVKGCGGGDKSGTVMVRFSIQPNGSVGSATITNGKKGTPEGGCVLGIVRSMKFPAFGGSAKTVNFPFRI